jgi:hypothetical protein
MKSMGSGCSIDEGNTGRLARGLEIEAPESSIGFLITASKFFKVFRQAPSRTLYPSGNENAWHRMQRQAQEPHCYFCVGYTNSTPEL